VEPATDNSCLTTYTYIWISSFRVRDLPGLSSSGRASAWRCMGLHCGAIAARPERKTYF
jgi:hypothetical protein